MTILGGVGLFLFGMLLMTDGLKTAAGSALNRILSRFTRLPIFGVFSGALVTALVQSSSATTLATIGFVSAGMLSFTQALGVILGINLGTTSTAWLVSLVGFKVDVAAMAFPLIALGAFMRLFSSGKVGAYGLVVAGFGLLFVGIGTLQAGMSGLAEAFDPARFSAEGPVGKLLFVGIGIVMTVILQSSSAAVATTLAALYTGAIGLEQAAVLVVGQNVGTTVKALLASLGASLAARRAAAAHILFNVITAVIALILIDSFVGAMRYLQDNHAWDGATTLAAFHTAFNVLGVMLFLPFTGAFAGFIMRLVPERGPAPTRHLNPKLIPTASAAAEAARRVSLDVATILFALAAERLQGRNSRALTRQLEQVGEALTETRRFLAGVRSDTEGSAEYRQHVSVLHAIDHLDRLLEACYEDGHLPYLAREDHARRSGQTLAQVLKNAPEQVVGDSVWQALPYLEEASREIAGMRRQQRPLVLEQTALGRTDPDSALKELEAMRWVDRLAYHSWRAAFHLQKELPVKTTSSELIL